MSELSEIEYFGCVYVAVEYGNGYEPATLSQAEAVAEEAGCQVEAMDGDGGFLVRLTKEQEAQFLADGGLTLDVNWGVIEMEAAE